MRHVSIRQSLQYVVDHPEVTTDDMLSVPAHELISRTLFEIANTADPKRDRSLHKANRARELIFNRLVGRRKPGSRPATRTSNELKFTDLTGEAADE